MVFVDPYMLTLCLVCVILMIFGNIYFLAHYSHHADSFFGSSALTKVILVSQSLTSEYRLHSSGDANFDDCDGCAKYKQRSQHSYDYVLASYHNDRVVLHLHFPAIWLVLLRSQ